ncbi:MAG: electron transfer flavoprotein subunit beta/FixA family protein [Mycobacteriales bacterium]
MRIAVPLKAVPDLVEEIELTPDGSGVDREYLKFVLNEWDDQALEEALLVAEAGGGEVVAIGLSGDPDIDQALYTAVAKGAAEAVKIDADAPDTHSRAAVYASYFSEHPADLVITGVQAPDDLDGQLPPMLAAHLDLPHVSVVVSVEALEGSVRVRQEFAGGRSQDLVVRTPAVIGLQASRQTPRYAPITRIRQVMQAGGIAEVALPAPAMSPALHVRRMFPPETTEKAAMLEGSVADVAERLVALLRERRLVKG